MKLALKISLLISLCLNVYFIYDEIQIRKWRQIMDMTLQIKDVSIQTGNNYLFDRIKKEYPQLSDRRYLYINIWNTACKPCIAEMPTLDSLASHIQRKDIGYIFLTENSDKHIKEFFKKKGITSKNFVYMNDGNEYISAILKEKGMKNKLYPIQLIIDKQGKIIYFQGADIKNPSDSTLISTINALAY